MKIKRRYIATAVGVLVTGCTNGVLPVVSDDAPDSGAQRDIRDAGRGSADADGKTDASLDARKDREPALDTSRDGTSDDSQVLDAEADGDDGDACTPTTCICPAAMAGAGTSASPCIVTTCVQLQAIGQSVQFDYQLGNDIDCSDTKTWNGGSGFVPLPALEYQTVPGGPTESVQTLDGAGHTVDRLFIDLPQLPFVGLFRSGTGHIANLGLTHVSITGADEVGALAGGLGDFDSVTNCYSTGKVTGSSSVGGLAGVSDGVLTGSHSEVTVSGFQQVGGLVGFLRQGTVSDAFATGAVSVVGNGGGPLGGLIGECEDGSASDSYATGAVSAPDECGYIGGLMGQGCLNLTNCFATGSVSVGNGGQYVGGLVGYGSQATNCYATGNVSAPGGTFVGGLSGRGVGSATNSFFTGAITGSGITNLGGLIGTGGLPPTNSYWYVAPGTTATHCYNAVVFGDAGLPLDGDIEESGDTNCTKITPTTGVSYFYDVTNAPMSSWTFDATDWSASCSPTSGFPTLAFQNLAGVSKCTH